MIRTTPKARSSLSGYKAKFAVSDPRVFEFSAIQDTPPPKILELPDGTKQAQLDFLKSIMSKLNLHIS